MQKIIELRLGGNATTTSLDRERSHGVKIFGFAADVQQRKSIGGSDYIIEE